MWLLHAILWSLLFNEWPHCCRIEIACRVDSRSAGLHTLLCYCVLLVWSSWVNIFAWISAPTLLFLSIGTGKYNLHWQGSVWRCLVVTMDVGYHSYFLVTRDTCLCYPCPTLSLLMSLIINITWICPVFKIVPNYLGFANKLHVAHNNFTPVFFCNSRARSVISSKLALVSAKVSPSGATSLVYEKNNKL